MTSLALLIIASLLNASKVINMDMVKPIPPKKPTPNIEVQVRSFGSLQNLNVTAKNVNKKMPNGLPTMSPSAMPVL